MTTKPAHSPLCSPRDHAAAILAEPSRERRNQLLQACPEHWRELVREHVQSAFARVKQYRQHKTERVAAAKQRPTPAPRRDDTSFRISDFQKSAPEVGRARLAELRASLHQEHP
ncbi:MAG: hypothetical protein NDI93_01985 [Pseudomonas sp.]|nr:hypothetical protein [Pseudomonas sp.]